MDRSWRKVTIYIRNLIVTLPSENELEENEREVKMRFIHIADIHLGADPYIGSSRKEKREKEIWTSLERVLEVCESKHVEMLLDRRRLVSQAAAQTGTKRTGLSFFKTDHD